MPRRAWFEKNDPQGVALQHEAMDVPLIEYWRANGARDQSLFELGWSNFL
jgi:hypothetical protein